MEKVDVSLRASLANEMTKLNKRLRSLRPPSWKGKFKTPKTQADWDVWNKYVCDYLIYRDELDKTIKRHNEVKKALDAIDLSLKIEGLQEELQQLQQTLNQLQKS